MGRNIHRGKDCRAAGPDAHDGWRDKQQRVTKLPADVAIGDYQVKQATVRIFDMDLSGETMVLGADFLRAHRVLIAMSQRKLYVTPVKDGMFAD